MDILIRKATTSDLDLVTHIEATCFPPAEAAPREAFKERLDHYAGQFLIAFDGDTPIGFIDGFVTDDEVLTDEMFADASLHNPHGAWQMIFGLNTLPEYRNRGVGGKLIEEFIDLAREEKRKGVILTCKEEKIPYYANVQGLGTAFQKPVLAGFVTVLYRIAFRKVKYVFFENKENAREFGERNIVSADRQVVLPGAGINLEKYKMEPYPNHSRVHFLYLGRIMKEKGIEELFYAVRRLKEENEDFVLDLAGFFEDIYKKQVEELEQLGIAHFYGFQSDPRPFYTEADCVVLPSYHEGMSNVLLEAAATGRPVITSNIPGCRESVENGKSGLLVEVKNKEMLYQAMKKMLHCSREEREKMGKAGREKMKREFRKEAVVERTVRSLE